MSIARIAALSTAIVLAMSLASTVSAQTAPTFGGGSMIGNRPQDDAAVAPAPALSRLGSLFTGDALALRRWLLELSARPAARSSAVRSAPAQRKPVKRDHVWVP
jgi:hypothetical protein